VHISIPNLFFTSSLDLPLTKKISPYDLRNDTIRSVLVDDRLLGLASTSNGTNTNHGLSPAILGFASDRLAVQIYRQSASICQAIKD